MNAMYHATDHTNKRIRLSSPSVSLGDSGPVGQYAQSGATDAEKQIDAQTQKEVKVGITEYVSDGVAGFSGVFKKRYTDFLINEVLPSGEVLHLKSHVEAQAQSRPGRDDGIDKNAQSQNIEDTGSKSNRSAPKIEDESGKMPIGKELKDDDCKVEIKDISLEDRAQLTTIFEDGFISSMVLLWNKIAANPYRRTRDFKTLVSRPIEEKVKRTQAHQLVRRIFNSALETKTLEDNTIIISAAPKTDGKLHQSNPERRRRGNLSWNELGGEYLHFTLYKENKDTMEVISYLASRLKLNPKHFQFAGTKDRRGIAVQRVSVYRVDQSRLVAVAKTLRNATIGDFEYRSAGLELGDLNGNKFGIVLRDCQFYGSDTADMEATMELARSSVGSAVESLRKHGFINYYGLQRFGSFAVGTDVIGLKLLQGDLEGATKEILSFNKDALTAAQNADSSVAISSDDKARAMALDLWATTHDAKNTLEKLPKKFNAEANLIRHLGHVDRKSGQQNRRMDFQGALMSIPRNLRLMYVHAYQSLVWNVCAGHRWRLHKSKVVKGDLVLVHEHRDKEPSEVKESSTSSTNNTVHDNDDLNDVILPADPTTNEDRMTNPDNTFIRARALTQEEADSGHYTIFDIVLPQPGFDVFYPANETGDCYRSFMASERGGGLNPYDMRRKWKDISLSGGYRKLLASPQSDLGFVVKVYERDEEQLVMTDLDRLRELSDLKADTKGEGDAGNDPEPDDQGDVKGMSKQKKVAVVLTLQLGTSQYATMALRELMKTGIITYKPNFGAGR